jgi:hypothetical protein
MRRRYNVVSMARDPEARISVLLDSIREADTVAPEDKDALETYNREVRRKQSQIGTRRRLKNLRHLGMMAGYSQKYDPEELPDIRLVDCLEDRDTVGVLLDWIHDQYPNPETNRDFRSAIRSFGKHYTDGQDHPDHIAEVSGSPPSNYNPTPDPAKMYRWEDHILPMIEACQNPRDKALIATAWDSGARPEGFKQLRVGDVADHKYGMSISVEDKQGQRSIVLITAVPYLQTWLAEHPRRDDPSAALWCKLSDGSPISGRMKLKILKQAAEKADMTPPSSATFARMRKSSASYLASQGVNQAHLEDHHGWTRGSDVASRYISVFTEANDRAIAAAHGVDVQEDEPDPIGPVTCPRCEEQTPRQREFCINCGQALDQEAVQTLDEVVGQLEAQAVDHSDPDVRADAIEAARRIRSDPGRIDTDELHEVASRLSSE